MALYSIHTMCSVSTFIQVHKGLTKVLTRTSMLTNKLLHKLPKLFPRGISVQRPSGSRRSGLSWACSLNTLSSTGCEYKGAAIATCEAIWLKRLLKDFNESVDEPIRIYCDNQSNIQLARNSVFHPRTKHIEVHYCYVREHIIVGDIDIVYICTNLQMVDIFTKTLGTTKLQQFSLALDLRPFNTTSLRHMLEGEESKLPQEGWRKSDINKDVKYLTLELQGACWDIKLN